MIDKKIFTDTFKSSFIRNLYPTITSSLYILNETNTYDSVAELKRSFSLLIMVSLLVRDYDYLVLKEDDLSASLKALNEFINLENKWTFVHENYGIVHTLSHFSDVLGAILAHPNCSNLHRKELTNLLISINEVFPLEKFNSFEVQRLSKVFAYLVYTENTHLYERVIEEVADSEIIKSNVKEILEQV